MKKLSHTDSSGKAIMVDIGDKPCQIRIARAMGTIRMTAGTLKLIEENKLKKGDVFAVAQLAGINAAKETHRLIPLCHNILLEDIKVGITPIRGGLRVQSEIRSTGKTGVEMEALTAVSVALLTLYDMCKSVDKGMVIEQIMLTEKLKK
jgi:cyclic pyranopterin phosphate synthase